VPVVVVSGSAVPVAAQARLLSLSTLLDKSADAQSANTDRMIGALERQGNQLVGVLSRMMDFLERDQGTGSGAGSRAEQ
jgi:hypothetical protein